MELLSIVRGFGPIESGLSSALYRAFVSGIEAEEACLLLDLNFPKEKALRRIQTRKIVADMKVCHLPCHAALLEQITARFPQYTYHQCQRASDCLSALYDVADDNKKDQILRLLLDSQHKGLRRYAYNKLFDNWNTVHEINQKSRRNRKPDTHLSNWRPALASDIETLWREHQEAECARIITAHFPEEFLIEHFEQLQGSMEWPHLQQLYERTFPKERRVCTSALSYDPVTAMWVLADMGVVLDEEEALAIFSNAYHLEKSNLLIACFGRMGLWNALWEIYQRNLNGEYGELCADYWD